MLTVQQLSLENAAQSKLKRSLYQLLRMIGNMSDASGSSLSFRPERQNVDAVFREIAEKVTALTDTTGIQISYSGLQTDCSCVFDRQLMERAVLNMVSNALKFTPAGGTVLCCCVPAASSSASVSRTPAAGFPKKIKPPCSPDICESHVWRTAATALDLECC